MHLPPSRPARQGNAIVAALGVLTIAAVLAVTATDSTISTAKSARQITYQEQGLAALDTVLIRHQLDVVELANQGDPTVIGKWQKNYGADMVGSVEVRWKVEPVRTPPNDATPVGAYPSGSPLPFITNPCPDPNWIPPTAQTNWNTNDNNYLFRISGEARVGTGADGKPLAVVQGARYTSVNKEPLFRYVIFYAQQGPKGDLELSHADPVNIQGSVHTNGALYVGGGLKVNSQILRLGSIDGNLNPTTTIIGPDAPDAPRTPQPVRVNGVDGIFRISKPLMYAIINKYPLSTTDDQPTKYGTAGSSNFGTLRWDADSNYSLMAKAYPTETAMPTLTTVASATSYGSIINPYRILNGCGAITENLFGSGYDDYRKIANKPTSWTFLRGVTNTLGGASAYVANDSRDDQRGSPSDKWAVASLLADAPGFNGYARTKLTGQGVKKLPSVLANQGLEPQPLVYIDYDGNSQTDEHAYARPKFLHADGTATADFPNSLGTNGWPTWQWQGANAVVEACGQYLRYALGTTDAYMVRNPDGSGWGMLNLQGNKPTGGPTSGLIIRERPIPDTDYWPGTSGASIVDPSDPHWLPFAYGKAWYPNLSPFTVCDITDQLFPGGTDPLAADRISTLPANRIVSYAPGGRLTVTTAQNPARNQSDPYSSLNDVNYNRKPYYYGQNWRFIHLRKAAKTATAGLLLSAFNDRPTGTNTQSLDGDAANRIAITVPADSIVTTPSFSGVTPSLTGYRSARFEGYITPPATGTYEFSVALGGSQYARVWINNQLFWSNWLTSASNPQRLTGGTAVPIQIDWCNNNGGAPSLTVSWRTIDTTPLPAFVTIPASAFTTRSDFAFPQAQFTAVEMRIDRPSQVSGPSNAKIGLMLRDASAGMSPLANGTAPYVFLGWSPTRGFFTERRMVRHLQTTATTAGTFYIGNGTGPSGPVSGTGETPDNSTTVAAVSRTAYLKESARSAITSTTSGPTNSQGVNYSAPTWSGGTAFSGTTSRDVGGGKVWTLLTSFSTGVRTGTRTATPYARTYQSAAKNQSLTLAMSGQVAPFFPQNGSGGNIDHNQTLRAFTSTTGTGQYTTNNAQGTLFYSATYAPVGSAAPPADGRWYFYGPLATDTWQANTSYLYNSTVLRGGRIYRSSSGGVSGTAGPAGTGTGILDGSVVWNYIAAVSNASAPYTQVRKTFNTSWTSDLYNYGTAVPQTQTAGSATTIWYSSTIQINKNGTVSNATLADINTVTGQSFTAMTASSSTPGFSALASPSYPPYPAAVAFTAPADPALPDYLTGSGRTFQVQRAGGQTITFDLNSFVSGSATWFTTAVAQYVPWANPFAAWSGMTPATPPSTQGFRPDACSTSTPPTAPPTSAAAYTGVTGNLGSVVAPYTNGWQMSDDVKPATLATATEVWLRIEQSGSPAKLHFKYFVGTTKPTGPADPGWVELNAGTAPVDLAGWGNLLVGPALQSGDVNTPISVTMTNLKVTTTAPNPDDVIDSTDWDGGGTGAGAMVKYLCSQYQVFWGPREITEDFFNWVNPSTSTGIASEDWIYNPRVFWSQSRWWDLDYPDGTPFTSRVQKDVPVNPKTTFNSTTIREALGKVTMLTLDMRNLQDYLASRQLSQATAYVSGMVGTYNTGWPAITPANDYTLRSQFNGLIYAVRTNRYPWNPNIPKWNGSPLGSPFRTLLNSTSTALQGTSDSGINPWSPSTADPMPNSASTVDTTTPDVADRVRLDTWSSANLLGPGGLNKLQPYPATILPEAPAFKPEDFAHGIRIVNGASIDWGYQGGRSVSTYRTIADSTNPTTAYTWNWSSTPAFGASKTSIVTPNALYVQGNLNVDQHLCSPPGGGTAVAKFTPLAIMGDCITLLSNSWKDTDNQVPGLTVTDVAGAASVAGTGTLACPTYGAFASSAEYNAAIATHNQPTTRERVAEGQAAPFIDATQFLENWNGHTMTYMGSLVVMDVRRYTRSFLLDSFKTYGQTPFGITGSSDWLNSFNGMLDAAGNPDPLYGYNVGSADWLGQSPIIYSEPVRSYKFNYDLTTAEGTPPFAPFGVSAAGIGGWVRPIR